MSSRDRVRTGIKRSNYKLLALVGQGQFGKVYCALDRTTQELVALKDLDPRRFPTKQFLRELRFLISLRHPNIVACHGLEHYRQSRYLVMDYCEGGTLRSLLESSGQLGLELSLQLTIDILLGLEYAHQQGIIHCDIKPENILLRTQVRGWQACISDFGIARRSKELHPDANGDTGSPAYMAPERFYGQYSPASDLYAVGVLLYEMILGNRPFSGIPKELMAAHLSQPLMLPDSVPFILRSVLTKSLQKLPQRRFATAGEMLKSLRLAVEVVGSLEANPIFFCSQVPELPFQSLRAEALAAEVTGLTVATNALALVTAQGLSCYSYAQGVSLETDLLASPGLQWQFASTETVSKVFWTGQGHLLVLTQTPTEPASSYAYRFYELPMSTGDESGGNKSGSRSDSRGCDLSAPLATSVPPAPRRTLIASQLWLGVAPQGQWLVCATQAAGDPRQRLQLWRGTDWQVRQLETPPLEIPPFKTNASAEFLALTLLDHRYALVLTQPTVGTRQLEIFTRWGRRVIAVDLHLPLDELVANCHQPGLLFCRSHQTPDQGILINLRPWKIQHVSLGMVPHWVKPTLWGFVLAEPTGQVLLLSQFGKRLARFQVPGRLTALASLGEIGLLLATWDQAGGRLVSVDLQRLGLGDLLSG